MNAEIAQLLRELADMNAPYMMNYEEEERFYELQNKAEQLLEEEGL